MGSLEWDIIWCIVIIPLRLTIKQWWSNVNLKCPTISSQFNLLSFFFHDRLSTYVFGLTRSDKNQRCPLLVVSHSVSFGRRLSCRIKSSLVVDFVCLASSSAIDCPPQLLNQLSRCDPARFFSFSLSSFLSNDPWWLALRLGWPSVWLNGTATSVALGIYWCWIG